MESEPPDRPAAPFGDDAGGDVIGAVEDVVEGVGELVEGVEQAAEETYETFREDLLGRDGYLGVLVMTMVTMVAIPVALLFRGGSLLVSVCIALLVVTAMTRSKVNRTLRLVSVVITGTVVVLALVATVTGDKYDPKNGTAVDAAFILLYTAVIALCFPVILRRAFSHKKVTLNTVAASLAAYLLIGLVFAGAYRFVDVVANPMFSQPSTSGFTDEYFSYITLSTVGFGDYTPANDAGRTLAMLEALFGQAFLVTIVAMVVSNLGREHVQLRATRTAAATDTPPPDGPSPPPSG